MSVSRSISISGQPKLRDDNERASKALRSPLAHRPSSSAPKPQAATAIPEDLRLLSPTIYT